MKKVVLTGIAGLAVVTIAGIIVFRTIAAQESPGRASMEVSPKAAKSLQQKIDAIKKAEETPSHHRGSSRAEISDSELESYLLYSLKHARSGARAT